MDINEALNQSLSRQREFAMNQLAICDANLMVKTAEFTQLQTQFTEQEAKLKAYIEKYGEIENVKTPTNGKLAAVPNTN